MAEMTNPLPVVPSNVKTVLKEIDPALKITTVPLNGTNYLVWSKSASLYLCRRGKSSYVNGKVRRPEESEASYADWELNDRMLKAMWDELQQYRPFSSDLETVKRCQEEDRVFKLLAGLGSDFESVRSSILMMQPMPSFNTACAMIQREETRKNVMREDCEKKEDAQVAFVASEEQKAL
ncbi:unnamed protein product [Victoria cruziana]